MIENLKFSVSIPTDNGFLGCACNNKKCQNYFKIYAASRKSRMYCPYCGDVFNKDELLTRDQAGYVRESGVQQGRQHVVNEFQNMLKSQFGTSKARRSGITYRPGKIEKSYVTRRYRERKVDSELVCPACDTKFQVYGIFGYCPGCKEENVLVYDANLKIIEQEVENSRNPERELRRAYGDLVTAFETFCGKKASKLTTEKCNFQSLYDARRFFKKHGNVDILENLDTESLLALRRLFQKRHLYIHSDGTITEQYVKNIPEDKQLMGQKAPL